MKWYIFLRTLYIRESVIDIVQEKIQMFFIPVRQQTEFEFMNSMHPNVYNFQKKSISTNPYGMTMSKSKRIKHCKNFH